MIVINLSSSVTIGSNSLEDYMTFTALHFDEDLSLLFSTVYKHLSNILFKLYRILSNHFRFCNEWNNVK